MGCSLLTELYFFGGNHLSLSVIISIMERDNRLLNLLEIFTEATLWFSIKVCKFSNRLHVRDFLEGFTGKKELMGIRGPLPGPKLFQHLSVEL